MYPVAWYDNLLPLLSLSHDEQGPFRYHTYDKQVAQITFSSRNILFVPWELEQCTLQVHYSNRLVTKCPLANHIFLKDRSVPLRSVESKDQHPVLFHTQ